MSRSKLAITLVLIAATLAFVVERGEAHKPITSKYTYNDDVFPILQARCSQCHVPGGVAPMSLMTYEEAFPWAESIRAELVAAHMPPATADNAFGSVKKAHALSPKEIDVLLTWASGGNPRGALDKKLPAVELKNEWTLGQPDLALPLPTEFTLAADTMDATREFVLPTRTTAPQWVRAVDLLPGTPAIVRSAEIFVKSAPERVLARWLPGQESESLDTAAFRLAAGAELVARIRYKKTWSYEGKALSDRSTIGVYLAKGSERELEPLALAAQSLPAGKNETATFSQTIDRDVEALALSPTEVPNDVRLQVEAIRPDGSRAPLIRFNARADWTRRYWFEHPIALPRGTRIEIVARIEDPDLIAAAFGGPPSPPNARAVPLKLSLDVVPTGSKPSAP